MSDPPKEITEEDKAKELENKIRAPLVWGVDRRGIRVEDLQDKRFEEVLDILKEHFIHTEVPFRMLNFSEDEESVEDFILNSKSQLKDKMSLVAVKEATDEIIGILTQRIVDKITFSRTFSRTRIRSGKSSLLLARYYKKLEEAYDPHEIYQTDRYMKIFSVVFLPKYREKGLEKLLLESAMKAARSCKVTAIVGIFTSGAMQQYARETGFEMLNSIFYEKYIDTVSEKRIFYNPGNLNFSAELMGRKISEEGEKDDENVNSI